VRQPLKGKGIVVTRPAHQAAPLARSIEEAGARAVLFPAIEIRDMEDLAPFYGIVDELQEFDLAIFISPNAAERAIGMILGRRALPPGLRLAAIGGGGVRALAARGVTDVIAPEGRYDSEALLELPEVAAARRVAIFRGAPAASTWARRCARAAPASPTPNAIGAAVPTSIRSRCSRPGRAARSTRSP
jgi:uroporphyrinogen-III synthase